MSTGTDDPFFLTATAVIAGATATVEALTAQSDPAATAELLPLYLTATYLISEATSRVEEATLMAATPPPS